MDAESIRYALLHYSEVDIEGFLNELLEWYQHKDTGEIERNILSVVFDVFVQYLN